MAAPRRVIELAFTGQELADLERVSRSRTEPASRVERARIADVSPDALALRDGARRRRHGSDGRALSAARTRPRRDGGPRRQSAAGARAGHHQRGADVRRQSGLSQGEGSGLSA
jgi:hypothetical protein